MKIFETAKKANKNPLVEKCEVHEDETAELDVTTDVVTEPEMSAADKVDVEEPVDIHAQFDTVIDQIPAFAEFVATLAAKLAGTDALATEACSDKSKKDMVKEEEVKDEVEVEVDSDEDKEDDLLDAEVIDDEEDDEVIDAELEDEADEVEDDIEDEVKADEEAEETKDAAEALAELTMQDWLDVLAKID